MASGVLREAAEFTYVDASVGSRVPQEGVLCAFSWRHSAGKSRGEEGRRGSLRRRAGGHLAEAFALHFQLQVRTYEDASALVKTVPERDAWCWSL